LERRFDTYEAFDGIVDGNVAKQIVGIGHGAVDRRFDEQSVNAREVAVRRRS